MNCSLRSKRFRGVTTPLFRFLALAPFFGRENTENPVPRSFFAPKPQGNACYAGYVLKNSVSTKRGLLQKLLNCRFKRKSCLPVHFTLMAVLGKKRTDRFQMKKNINQILVETINVADTYIQWYLYSVIIIHNTPEHLGKTTKRYFLLNQNLRPGKVSFHRVRERSDHDSENVLTNLRKGVLTSWNNDWFVVIHWHRLTTNKVQKHITLVSTLPVLLWLCRPISEGYFVSTTPTESTLTSLV